MNKTINAEDIIVKGKMFIYGDYVLSPQQNAFNEYESYWISKKRCTICEYAFTPESKEELDIHNIAKSLSGYINALEDTLSRLGN